MKSNSQDPFANNPDPQAVDETLRLIANLPVPEGLEDRVHAALHSAPRRGRLLAWPGLLRPSYAWMRTAAAAAIVFVVVGGGWGVYSRVQKGLPARTVAMPAQSSSPGGFSGASAIRTPQTLNAPALIQPAKTRPLPRKASKKAASRIRSAAPPNGQPEAADKSAPQAAAPASK
jgi:hypothetical protein